MHILHTPIRLEDKNESKDDKYDSDDAEVAFFPSLFASGVPFAALECPLILFVKLIQRVQKIKIYALWCTFGQKMSSQNGHLRT